MNSNLASLSDKELKALYAEKKRQANQLHNRQMMIKILINALYGAVANKYFCYFIEDVAESITMSGQLSIRIVANAINDYLNKILKTEGIDYVTYSDTDSTYVNMAPLIEKVFGTVDIDKAQGEEFLDKVCEEKIQPVIDACYKHLAETMGVYENAMSMKREKINRKGLMIASKRYILSTLNSEGVHYDEPKISVTGVESVRSSTPEICRDKMKDLFKTFMDGTEQEVQDFIETFRKEFYSLPAHEVAKNSGTDDIAKYEDKTTLYKKGCPIHIRGVILYNNYLKQKNLLDKYTPISSGDKIKFVYLKLPNPLRENVIAFPDKLPKEFALEDYIDYETQFEKVFLKPMVNILEVIGWSAEKVDTLESFFG